MSKLVVQFIYRDIPTDVEYNQTDNAWCFYLHDGSTGYYDDHIEDLIECYREAVDLYLDGGR